MQSPKLQRLFQIMLIVTATIALITLLLVAVSAAMTRVSPLEFRQALTYYRYAIFASVFATVLAVLFFAVSIWLRRTVGVLVACVALLLSVPIFASGLAMQAKAKNVPAIHDITTDVENPPAFKAIVALREQTASNDLVYDGPELAAQQQQAYPDIQPLVLDVPIDRVFQYSLEAANEMGWELVEHNQEDGRIEATDTTQFFGFKDDVVVRLQSFDDRTRIDVRSVSRVGISDVGANASRISRYLSRIRTLAATSVGE